jgi:hypothetical protein
MYPQRELNRLHAYKAALRMDLAFRRHRCVEAAIAAARPVEWLDRMLAFCRRLAPAAFFAALPLAFLARRAIFSRAKAPGLLLRWGLLAFGAVRLIDSATTAGPKT